MRRNIWKREKRAGVREGGGRKQEVGVIRPRVVMDTVEPSGTVVQSVHKDIMTELSFL